jgi:hypothetical protein
MVAMVLEGRFSTVTKLLADRHQDASSTERSGRHELIPFSPSLPDITKNKPIETYAAGTYMLFLCEDVLPIGGAGFASKACLIPPDWCSSTRPPPAPAW